MGMKFGLTDEHREQLANGESVTFVVAGLVQKGYNSTITIEPADLDDVGQYTNAHALPTDAESTDG